MAQQLTDPALWNGVHERLRTRGRYPKPRRHLMDAELDTVFRRFLGPLRGGHILEVGCGSSRWLPYFARELGLRVHGLDYSASGIAGARQNLEACGVEGDLIENDLVVQAESDHPRVDAVFSLGLLEHFSDPSTVLTAMNRFVNPGGLVITLVPNVAGRILRLSCRLNPGLESIYTSLDLDAWRDVHVRSGLELIEGEYAQFFDWTWLNLARLSTSMQVWVSRLFRLVGLPVLLAGRYLDLRLQSPTWCSAIIVVARKPVV